MNSGKKSTSHPLVVCVENDGYGASLETRKIYLSVPDTEAQKHGLLRIIDESGGGVDSNGAFATR